MKGLKPTSVWFRPNIPDNSKKLRMCFSNADDVVATFKREASPDEVAATLMQMAANIKEMGYKHEKENNI